MARRKRAARVLLALTALALVPATCWQCRPRPEPPADEAALWDRLKALGYELHWEPEDRRTAEGRLVLSGLYAWRPGAATTWEEGAAQVAGLAPRWRGLVVARHAPEGLGNAPEQPMVGSWVFFGDPVELDRIGWELAGP
jgi:hypothetical protein